MAVNRTTVVLPIRTVDEGRVWKLYMADYETPEGKFSLHFHAISMDHAAALVQDIKDSLTLLGEVDSTFTEADL